MTRQEREAEFDRLLSEIAPLNNEKALLTSIYSSLSKGQHLFFTEFADRKVYDSIAAKTREKIAIVNDAIEPLMKELRRLTITMVEQDPEDVPEEKLERQERQEQEDNIQTAT